MRIVAVNCCVPPGDRTLAEVGATVTVMRVCAVTDGTSINAKKVITVKAAKMDSNEAERSLCTMSGFPLAVGRVVL